jgi:single-strand DNA-binding protein
MLNKVMLIGNLGKDPEVRHLESGSTVASFSVATNENYRDKSGEWQTVTEWHNVVAWRQLAERAERDLKKGNRVYVEGKITTRKWQDRDGNDRYTTEVVANTLRLLDRRERDGDIGSSNFPSSADEPSKAASNFNSNVNQTSNVEAPSQEDDLPF